MSQDLNEKINEQYQQIFVSEELETLEELVQMIEVFEEIFKDDLNEYKAISKETIAKKKKELASAMTTARDQAKNRNYFKGRSDKRKQTEVESARGKRDFQRKARKQGQEKTKGSNVEYQRKRGERKSNPAVKAVGIKK